MSFLQPTLFSKLVCNCDQLVSIWPFYNSWYLRWNFKRSFLQLSSFSPNIKALALLWLLPTFFYKFLVSLNPADCQGLSRAICRAAAAASRPISPTMPAQTNGACQPLPHGNSTHHRHKIQLNFLKLRCFCQKKGDLRRLMGATRD